MEIKEVEYTGTGEEFYIDKKGYMRYKKDDKLIHRDVAFKEVYRKNKNSFPRRFSEYDVHHMDGNKLNNNPSNLALKSRDTHKMAHEIRKREKNLKNMNPNSEEYQSEVSSIEFQKEELFNKTAGDLMY